ncbi:hypothetical protein OTU49_015873 [Cherax quadricarinatus]|uniref:Small ribosomal subunit protein mS26 n=1 Tax=Cherax quadricarinatus TaxID=27406 RepID=A0AAW0XVM1_CHEQU
MNIGVRSNLVALGCGARLWYPVHEAMVTLTGSQTVRWIKPRWVPVAKSKMFRIPERKPLPLEEEVELRCLYNNYYMAMRAIRRHLCEERLRVSDTSELAIKAEEEQAEHDQLMEHNSQENLRVAALREARIKKEFEADLARVTASKEKLAKDAEKAEEEALRIINETQEFVKTFIKREDFEKAIETALANPVDYNFAIDQQGNIFRGRSTRPEDVAEEDKEKLLFAVQS